ncbi:DUF6271 family protein [Streptomyces sp. NBC_01260]|uniref:DUF6271 family protein n=1 Tax=Streptomyces sp. NBC_01260 TaxID=2903801 RepID=UPI003FCD33FF
MRRVCLTLPTNRPCAETIAAVAAEAAHGARHFGVEVHLLILDSSDAPVLAGHRAAVSGLPRESGVVVHHLDEAQQRTFLREVATRSGVAAADRVVDLMLPDRVSYGACTNRAFLIAEALGCESVHRRDSDSRYQSLEGEPVFPLHQELASLGRRAADVASLVSRSRLDPAYAHRPVAMAGGSFIGEMSVDVEEIRRLDPAVHHDLVGLSVPDGCPEIWRRKLIEESFRGAGTTPFTTDLTTLTRVAPSRVDMCNIAFDSQVYGAVPLPPATDTIGSDYFLIHLVHDARLPGVLHNRHIVNYHTGERRTGAGFVAYQVRLAKFLLSMPYFNAVYAAAAAAGDTLLDPAGRVRACAVAALVRDSTRLDPAGNAGRFDLIERSYRALGGRYTAVAEALAERRGQLLDEARADMEDFAVLIDAWEPLVRAAGRAGIDTGTGTNTGTGSETPQPGTAHTVTLSYAGGEERRGPVTMGQANMIRCILRDEPLHINNHDVWPVPAGTAPEQVLDALRTLVVRHEALRTTFPEPADGASRIQVVAAEGDFTVRVLDHEEFGTEPARYAETVARRARAGRFRLDRDFPLRITLLTLRGAPAFVSLSSSHAVTDGSALAVLREEWLGLLAGAELPPVEALTPLDLAAEEATPAGLRRSEASLRYWQRTIGTGPQEMFAEPRATRTDGQQPQLTLRSLRGARALAQVAKRTGSPSPTVLLTAWCTLVAHRAGQSTCVAAAPLSNRSRPGLARSVNTLSQDALLSLDVRGLSFDAVLRKAWGAALSAYRHSQFDSVRLWEAIEATTFERGSHFARDVVFNDVSVLTDARGPATGQDARDARDAELDLDWGPVQVLPTRLLCFAYRTAPLLHLGMWADPALFPREEAEAFLTGLVALLEAAAYEDVPLASLTQVTGVRPAGRDGDWRQVDGCWTSPLAVAGALSGALGGLPVHVGTAEDSAHAPGGDRAPAGLTAFIASGGAPLTPADAHTALMDVISGPGPSGLLAPARYVIVHDPPAAPGDSPAWLRQRILMEGNGRHRPTRDDH